MALKTFGEQLEEVQNAITSALKNQSYGINGRQFTRANLDELRVMRDGLEEKCAKYGADATGADGIKRKIRARRVITHE